MKKASREYLKRLSKQDLSKEFGALNALQNTAWRTNNRVIEIIRNVWDSGQEWAGLPPREDLPLPPYPFTKEPKELDERERVEFRDWRKRRNGVYTFNHKSMSKRIQVERTIQLAEDYTKHPEFYFVWQCDFRSRKYPVESFMSPQVADWGKATIEFARGVLMESAEDARWLAIHGANLFGNDKISLVDREIWAYLHEDDVVRVAENPMDYLWWTEADKPWQFLAWCFEWYGWLREGKGFVTHLPVSADGSCNGLQNLSAILRDERGGSAVNLCDTAVPADIYSDVALLTEQMVRDDAANGIELARQCLEFGITRKLTKRPCMIVPYSGTQHACRQYVEEAIEEEVAKGKPNPWGNDYFTPSLYLSGYIWNAIDGVIGSARQVMDYVKDIGSIYAARKRPMEWITPTNFLVRQAYPDTKLRRIQTIIDGSIIRLAYQHELEGTVDRSKTRMGASPNFIHSLDAAHLTLTINRCKDIGIDDFAMVHDSYGTHSPNMGAMSQLLREAFVDMYEKHDVLSELRLHACSVLGTEDVPEPPSKGSLDISNVLKSKYFFS
jgi:DNA-directed RNA polymerase